MRVPGGTHSRLILAALVLVAALAVVIAPASAKNKKGKVRQTGPLTLATQSYRIDAVDQYQRLTVGCPGGQSPYGGGLITSPPPGPDGQGVYPNSYERLGAQRGYHITGTLINPGGGPVAPRNATLQVVCGRKIGKLASPHKVENFRPGEGPRTIVAKCPKNATLIGGGYQRSDGITDRGVVTTESHRTSKRSWQVVAHSMGGFVGQAVSIGYCVQSKKPLITEVSGSVTVPTGQAETAVTSACPPGRQLAFGGFSTPPSGSIRFMGAGFTDGGTWSATGFNTGPTATLTAYGYCLRA
jgi:hypothetical protein